MRINPISGKTNMLQKGQLCACRLCLADVLLYQLIDIG